MANLAMGWPKAQAAPFDYSSRLKLSRQILGQAEVVEDAAKRASDYIKCQQGE